MTWKRKKDRVIEPPNVNYNIPADTEHLFCRNCISMYKKNKYPYANNILLVVHPDSRGAEMKGMMPLLKAWAAFMDYFTGTQTTFTLGKLDQKYRMERAQTWEKTGWQDNEPNSLVTMTIGDDKMKSSRGARGETSSCYAYMAGIGYVRLKSGILLAMKPETALTFMVHEFTSHRFCKDFQYIVERVGKTYLVEGTIEEGIHANMQHFGGKGHHLDETIHCTTDRKSKYDRKAIKCINGFIDHGFANIINARPFFKKWYDDHKDDPLTMSDSSKAHLRRRLPPSHREPSPAPPPSPPSRPLGYPFMKDSEKKISEVTPIWGPTGGTIDPLDPYAQMNSKHGFVESPSIGGVAEMTRRGFSGVTSDTDDTATSIEFIIAPSRFAAGRTGMDLSKSFVSSENVEVIENLLKTNPQNIRISESRGGHAALNMLVRHTKDTLIGTVQKSLWDLAQNFKQQRPWSRMLNFEQFKESRANLLGTEWDKLDKDASEEFLREWAGYSSTKTGYRYGNDETKKYDESIYNSLTDEEKKQPDPSKLKGLFDLYKGDSGWGKTKETLEEAAVNALAENLGISPPKAPVTPPKAPSKKERFLWLKNTATKEDLREGIKDPDSQSTEELVEWRNLAKRVDPIMESIIQEWINERLAADPALMRAKTGETIDLELVTIPKMEPVNKTIISNPGGPLTTDTSFNSFYATVENAPDFLSYNEDGFVTEPPDEDGVERRVTPLKGTPLYREPAAQLINAVEATKHFNNYRKNEAIVLGGRLTPETTAWGYASKDTIKEPVFISDWRIPEGTTLYAIGDIHSGIHSLAAILKHIGVTDDWKLPHRTKVIFCGDYVDRGPYGIECLYAVTKLHMTNPDTVRLIEGNHEDPQIYNRYGFGAEMVEQYSEDLETARDATVKMLRTMPAAIFVRLDTHTKMIQFCHGGMVLPIHEGYAALKNGVMTEQMTMISENASGHPLKWGDFRNGRGDIKATTGRWARGTDSTIAYCDDLNLLGIISGHQDKYNFLVQANPPTAQKLGFKDSIIGEDDLSIIAAIPGESVTIPMGEDVLAVTTSAALPVRDSIENPSFIKISI